MRASPTTSNRARRGRLVRTSSRSNSRIVRPPGAAANWRYPAAWWGDGIESRLAGDCSRPRAGALGSAVCGQTPDPGRGPAAMTAPRLRPRARSSRSSRCVVASSRRPPPAHAPHSISSRSAATRSRSSTVRTAGPDPFRSRSPGRDPLLGGCYPPAFRTPILLAAGKPSRAAQRSRVQATSPPSVLSSPFAAKQDPATARPCSVRGTRGVAPDLCASGTDESFVCWTRASIPRRPAHCRTVAAATRRPQYAQRRPRPDRRRMLA